MHGVCKKYDYREEMTQIDVINHTSSESISQIAESHGKGQAVRDIWQNNMRLQFNKDQAKNGNFSSLYKYIFLSPPPFLSQKMYVFIYTET